MIPIFSEMGVQELLWLKYALWSSSLEVWCGSDGFAAEAIYNARDVVFGGAFPFKSTKLDSTSEPLKAIQTFGSLAYHDIRLNITATKRTPMACLNGGTRSREPTIAGLISIVRRADLKHFVRRTQK